MTALRGILKIAKVFKLPTVVTTSIPDGPNGPVLSIVTEIMPDATVVNRNGEIDAFDLDEFKDAVAATGRKKLILIGITTDVCLSFASLHALSLGYDVYAVIDASGSNNPLTLQLTVTRLAAEGVKIMTWLAVGSEIMQDWRNEGGEEFGAILGEGLPWYGSLQQAHAVWTSG